MHETVLIRCYDDNIDILYHSLELKYIGFFILLGRNDEETSCRSQYVFTKGTMASRPFFFIFLLSEILITSNLLHSAFLWLPDSNFVRSLSHSWYSSTSYWLLTTCNWLALLLSKQAYILTKWAYWLTDLRRLNISCQNTN